MSHIKEIASRLELAAVTEKELDAKWNQVNKLVQELDGLIPNVADKKIARKHQLMVDAIMDIIS